jgi:hypothetical protein
MNVELACIECGGPICLPQARHDYLQRTKKTFYCPAGHAQSFLGEPVTVELVKTLRRDLDRARAEGDRARAEGYLYLGMVRSCPFGCGWHPHGAVRLPETLRAALAGHLVEKHGARAGVMLELSEKASA